MSSTTRSSEERPKKLPQFKKKKTTKSKKELKFNIFQSSAAATAVATVVFAIAAALVVAPIFIPEIFAGSVRRGVKSSANKFLLTDDVNNGLFRASARSGDTRPTADAAFMGSALSDSEISPALKTFATSLGSSPTMKNVYYSLSILGADKVDKSKYVRTIASFREPSSGWRPDSDRSATLESTYYALESLKLLGELSTFKELPQVVEFVQNLQVQYDNFTVGFRNSLAEPPTLTSTFYAVEILAQQDAQVSGVAEFILACQRQDGGFLNMPARSPEEASSPGNVVDTVRALQALHRLGANSGAAYTRGNNYLRACLTSNGVVSSYGSNELSLEGAFLFSRLIEVFPSFSYGISRSVQMFFPAAGLLVLLYGAFVFYREQLNEEIASQVFMDVLKTLIPLVAGTVLSSSMPRVAILVYLALGFLVATRFFRIVLFDSTSNELVSLVVAQSAVFLIGIFVLLSFSPLLFTTVSGLAVVTAWTAFSFFLVSAFSSNIVTKKTRPPAFIQAAYVSWVINTIAVMSLVTGGDATSNIFRIIQISGLYPLLFVSLPIVFQVLSMAGAALGLVFKF